MLLTNVDNMVRLPVLTALHQAIAILLVYDTWENIIMVIGDSCRINTAIKFRTVASFWSSRWSMNSVFWPSTHFGWNVEESMKSTFSKEISENIILSWKLNSTIRLILILCCSRKYNMMTRSFTWRWFNIGKWKVFFPK